jgi:DNA-binding transcriptional MerR regulator
MKKLYYSIGEISERTGVEPHILRYWETVFPQFNPSKNRAGKRIYTEKHLETALKLKDLVKDKKFSTAGALKVLENKSDSSGHAETNGIAIDLKKDLTEIKLLLQRIQEEL